MKNMLGKDITFNDDEDIGKGTIVGLNESQNLYLIELASDTKFGWTGRYLEQGDHFYNDVTLVDDYEVNTEGKYWFVEPKEIIEVEE